MTVHNDLHGPRSYCSLPGGTPPYPRMSRRPGPIAKKRDRIGPGRRGEALGGGTPAPVPTMSCTARGENRGSAAHPLRGVVIMTFVATASVTEPVPRTPASRPNLVSVGTIIWLSSELMFFAALFAMYFTIRSVDKGQALPWPMAHRDLPLGSTNTTVLVLSSVTCQMGVFAVERGQIRRAASMWNFMKWGLREWYVLSFVMGLYFVCGQAYEWSQLVRDDHLTISSSNYGPGVYLATGFHGLH